MNRVDKIWGWRTFLQEGLILLVPPLAPVHVGNIWENWDVWTLVVIWFWYVSIFSKLLTHISAPPLQYKLPVVSFFLGVNCDSIEGDFNTYTNREPLLSLGRHRRFICGRLDHTQEVKYIMHLIGLVSKYYCFIPTLLRFLLLRITSLQLLQIQIRILVS